MPALNVSNIKDAKLGSEWLTAVYKGDAEVWKFPGMTQPTTLNQYYSHPSNKGSVAVKFWLHRPDTAMLKLLDLEVDLGSGFEKAPHSIQRAGNSIKIEYDGVMYYQWWTTIVLGVGGPVPDEPFKRWRVRYNGGAWSGQLPTQPNGSVDPEFPYFVIPGTPNFFEESEIEDG